jgi:hypothetical protein
VGDFRVTVPADRQQAAGAGMAGACGETRAAEQSTACSYVVEGQVRAESVKERAVAGQVGRRLREPVGLLLVLYVVEVLSS